MTKNKENAMFDYYEVSAMDANLDSLRGHVICKTFATYDEAKVFYDNIKAKHFLQDKAIIFRSADGKQDKIIESWDWIQGIN